MVKGAGEGLLLLEEGGAQEISCCPKKCLRGGHRQLLFWLEPSFKNYKLKETSTEGR